MFQLHYLLHSIHATTTQSHQLHQYIRLIYVSKSNDCHSHSLIISITHVYVLPEDTCNALLPTSIMVLTTMHVFVSSDGSVDSVPNYTLHSNMYTQPLCMF